MNNKVYINPKFNKVSSTNILPASNKMHVNPNFTSHAMQNKSRIYVNPHFINSNITQSGIIYENKITRNDYLAAASSTISKHLPVNIAVKSRYSLIRNTNKQVLPKQAIDNSHVGDVHASSTRTLKINKYKSVNFTDFKKKLDIKNTLTNKVALVGGQQPLIQTDLNVIPSIARHIPKYLDELSLGRSNIRSRFKLRNISLETNKKVSIASSSYKPKTKRHLRKNNIPCPLFKKYGKCLRSILGTCYFLHDKKHVSVCRKFMKGICHEKGCLLSHEITSKKMPTCYFYLRGMCTKENCPYIHVKLNEKTKVCLEFLKGYCEKGDKCLNRHITNQSTAKKNPRNQVNSSQIMDKQLIVHKYSMQGTKVLRKIARKSPVKDRQSSKIYNNDNRYYEDQKSTANISQSVEVIKPTRCKLGILPSFIKL